MAAEKKPRGKPRPEPGMVWTFRMKLSEQAYLARRKMRRPRKDGRK